MPCVRGRGSEPGRAGDSVCANRGNFCNVELELGELSSSFDSPPEKLERLLSADGSVEGEVNPAQRSTDALDQASERFWQRVETLAGWSLTA